MGKKKPKNNLTRVVGSKRVLTLTGRKAVTGLCFITPFLIGLIFFFGVPLIQSFIFSVGEIKTDSNGYTVNYIGFANYKNIFFEHASFIPTFLRTLKNVCWNVPLILIFSFFVSTLLNQKFKGRMFARALFFLPVVISCGVILKIENISYMESSLFNSGVEGTTMSNMLGGIHLSEYLMKLGVADSLISYFTNALAQVYSIINASGVQILILIAALQTIPESLYEASSIEGATAWENFWKITFPMVSPYILVTTVYTIIDSFLRVDNTQNMSSLIDTTANGLNYGLAASMAWIYFIAVGLILALVTFIISRYVAYTD